MTKKNNKNKPLWIVSLLLVVFILILTIVNYFYTNIKWARYNLPGLNFTEQEKGTDYFGEKYMCEGGLVLYVNIEGSWNDIRNRTARISMVDRFNVGANVENMKLKDVNENGVTYVYKENALIIDKNNVATFLIDDIAVSKNCKIE